MKSPSPDRRCGLRVGAAIGGWIVIAVLSLGAFSWAVALTAGPAAADNCKELVNEFNDLLSEANVQDCLRTGGPWGAVLGTVIAATAAGVGAAGLSGRKNPPDDGPPPQDDPCSEALNMKQHALDLFAKRAAKQQQIVEEFQRFASDSARFAGMFRTLKEQEYRIGLLRFYATVGNSAGCASIVVGIVGVLQALAVSATAQLAVVAQGAGTTGAGRLLLSQAMVRLNQALGSGLAVSSPWLPPIRSFDPRDFTGKDMQKPIWDYLAKVAGEYQVAAHHFNDTARTWANEAQQDLADIDQDIQNARSRFRTAFSLCDSRAADDSDMGEFEPSGTIFVPQAETNFGSMWFLGGFGGLVG